VKAFWKVGEEVKDSPILLDVGLGIGFKSMDHIWKIHPIVNKEDRKVVSSKVKVTLSGVKFHSKTSRVPQGFRAATFMNDS
jgi:hypothetical protein